MLNRKDTLSELPIHGIPDYSVDIVNAAVDRLLLHRQSVIKFKAALSSASGAVLDGDYSLGRISHNYFSNCIFREASLKRVAGAGSIFTDTQFVQTDLRQSTFQNGVFERCSFERCDLENNNMSECYFQDVIWNECAHGSANMTSSFFKNCRFIRTRPGNLAEAVLNHVYFEDIRLTNFNLEFSTFEDLQAKDLVLPFSQLPYIFGGLQYLLTTSDSVTVSSGINASGCITRKEYMNVLKDMEIFYSYRKEYFPLANILLAFQRYEEALAVILQGIHNSARQKDFRMCKYFCKLITKNGRFPAATLQRLYGAICTAAPVHSLSEQEYYQYLKHMPEVQSMLVENPDGYPRAILKLETAATTQDAQQISLMLAALDELLHLNGAVLVNPSISISHNSPIVFLITLCGLPITILAVSSLIFYMVSKACKAYNDVAQAIIATQTILENHRSAKLNQLEERKLIAEVAKLEQNNSGLQARLNTHQYEITKSGIVIIHAEMEGQDFDPLKWL